VVDFWKTDDLFLLKNGDKNRKQKSKTIKLLHHAHVCRSINTSRTL